MKLICFKGRNFGDALNEYLWEKLLPDFFDEADSEIFMGVGSVLGTYEDICQRKTVRRIIVFGSGCGYGPIPDIDNRYDIFFVRGPLTAKVLNLRGTLGLSDSAILVRAVSLPRTEKIFRYSYMPHWESELLFDWERICNEIGFNYISPSLDVSQVIDRILKSEVLIAEAMHGAIVADALRVPWIPVRAYDFVNIFKWTDWCTSLNIKYLPYSLLSLFEIEYTIDSVLKYNANNSHKLRDTYYFQLANTSFSTHEDIELVKERLMSIQRIEPILSNEIEIESITSNMMDSLCNLKKKYQLG